MGDAPADQPGPPGEPPAGASGASGASGAPAAGPADVRVSDADRYRVVDVLRSHCADGLLTLDEFSDRVGTAFGARTRSELAAVTADLPDSGASSAGGPAGAPSAQVFARREPTRTVVAIMTPNNRRGRWRAGQEVNAVSVMGAIQLDLRQAEIDGPELFINAVAVMGSIQVIVPEGIDVDLTGVPVMGSKHLQLADVPRVAGAPVIRVRAYPIMGSVEVRSRRTRTPEELAQRKAERERRAVEQPTGRELPGPAATQAGHGPARGDWSRVASKRERIERKIERHKDLADMVGMAAQEARAAIEQARREWERAAREWDRDSWTPDVPGAGAGAGAGRGRPRPGQDPWRRRGWPEPAGPPAPPGAPPSETAGPGASAAEGAPTAASPIPGQAAGEAPSAEAVAPEGPPSGAEDEAGLNASFEAGGPPTAPDGTVTILFSDICGSTELNERLGDLRTHDVIRAHNSIVRGHLEDHGGFEVKTAGDGVMAAFAGASKALRCAADIQRSVGKWREEHTEEPFAIHLGLHTGETIKEGNDFFGRTVILASRITAQAGPDEVLVSSLLKELTEWTGEFRFGDMREVLLKGVSVPQKVYALDWQSPGAV